MKSILVLGPALLGSVCLASSQERTVPRVLKHSDVVFMYQASPQTYTDYGATVLAWGGQPTPRSLEEAKGIKFFGSVGMVTEFARFHERFPQTYEQGLCRDVDGNPVKVPWLTDHQHKGIPYWWCCTQQPTFREYLQERIVQTVRAGADGVHIDDHMGTAGGLWLGLCFCDRCIDRFRAYLQSIPADVLKGFEVGSPKDFNFRDAVRQWQAAGGPEKRKVTQHPLWSHWTIYQCRAAAAFMEELRELAAKTAGRPVPMGANAGLLWPQHLCDYRTLDLFSAETDHHAEGRRFSDLPLVAYRMADALQRPYAATASGGDWAFVKEHNLPGLVRGWIALSYAAGHCFMAPHRQWCYTPQKGTHWYQGPAEKFAPLYQFVRRQAELLEDYEGYADLGIVLPHRAYAKNPGRWFDICNQLAAANLAYRLLVAGDEIVNHPLAAADLASCAALLIPEKDEFLPADGQLIREHTRQRRVFHTVSEVLTTLRPAVQAQAESTVRVLPRVKPGSAVIHLLNYNYDPERDDVVSAEKVRLQVDLKLLGVSKATTGRFIVPETEPVSLPVKDGTVEVPKLGLWGILVLEPPH
jgi:hypothetical protein